MEIYMKKNAKKGFTIVELVIVIAVIGILAAVLIPTFGGVIDKANRSAALQVATSVMKSTLAMSDTAALSAETIFAIGDTNGINYEFKYVGNKIQAIEKSTTPLTARLGGTKSEHDELEYDRIIVSTEAIESATTWSSSDGEKVKAIIKAAFGATGANLVNVKPEGFLDTNAAYMCQLTFESSEPITIAVYVNSDYPTDVVTFIPATQEDAPTGDAG